MADKDIVGWITVGGRKVPLRKGQSKSSAVKERASNYVKSGRKYPDGVKKKAREFADERNTLFKNKGSMEALQDNGRRTSEYARKQGLNEGEFTEYIGGLRSQRKRVVHKKR